MWSDNQLITFPDFPKLDIRDTLKKEVDRTNPWQNQSPEINPFEAEELNSRLNPQDHFNVHFDLRKLLMNMHSLGNDQGSNLKRQIEMIAEADESQLSTEYDSETDKIPTSFFEGLARVLSSRTDEYIDEFYQGCRSKNQSLDFQAPRDKFRGKDYFREYRECFTPKEGSSEA